MTSPVRIVLLDEHQLILDSLSHLLSSSGVANVVAKTTRSVDALLALEQNPADLLVLNTHVFDPNEVELCQRIRHCFPDVKILIIATNREGFHIRQALEAGVSGYMLKKADSDELLLAIRRIANGKHYFCDEVTLELAKGHPVPAPSLLPKVVQVTGRELEILTLITQEFTTSAIAEKLYVSVTTIETHRRNLLHKLGVKSTVGLALYATRHQLV
jgi:DNA-binding NarL/FixJ family response regulator